MMIVKNNKGQSTIEFILTFTATIGFIFLFLKMAINYTNGYMVHHATFMASRAFMVGDTGFGDKVEAKDQSAFELAKSVFDKNLPEGLIRNFDGQLKHNFPSEVALMPFVGLFVEYNQPFSMGFVGGKDPVKFRSESFLGREPTRLETITQVCKAIIAVGSIQGCDVQTTLEDNGG